MTEETKNELIPLKRLENPIQIFTENEMDKLIREIRKKCEEFVPDTSTDKGRKEIASMSYKVSTSKTALEKLSKDLTDDWRQRVKSVDAVRISMASRLDALRDEVRKPLTDYEEAEKKKVADFDKIILDMEAEGKKCIEDWQDIEQEHLKNIKETLNARSCKPEHEAWKEKFDYIRTIALERIDLALTKRALYEKEQAELKSLREAEAKRQEEEAEAQRLQFIKDAKEAEEKAKLEEKARIEKERADAADLARKEAKEEADKLAKEQAEKDALAKKEKEDTQALIQKQKEDAEQAKIEADKRAEQARADERAKIQSEENQRLADAKRREEDKEHQRKINKGAVDALVNAGISNPVAVTVIKAIIVGDVPNVKISY